VEWIALKATAGTGFKAPSFQQLYLAFTNPSAGYTVLGAAVFADEVARMQNAGEIKDLYPIASQVGDLKAERSASINAGFMLTPARSLTVEVNAFYNNINNMIFEELVGMKQNGSQLYSYRNIERAFTQGTETNFRYRLWKGIELSAGHQWLIAKDKGVVNDIRAGLKQVRTPGGHSRTATTADYFNLSNRSRHMLNMKIFVTHQRLGASASLRANYRGRYGIGDRNYPNNFIDPYDLYAKGYVLLNATLEKKLLKKKLSLQLICDNLTNYRNSLIPNLQQRQLMISAAWKFDKKAYE
jgi:outer membrane receptor for ferrienterochelin and colicins